MTLSPQEELQRLAAENLQLHKAVHQQTTELEHKNRELEIEAALERVRTSAMAMNKQEDMLSICRVIFHQLESLGVKNIRNVQTIILNDPLSSFTNFEYFNLYDKESIIEVPYVAHPVITDFVNQIRSSDDYFFFSKIEGESLLEWRHYLKTGQEKVDPRLESATALIYYMYSIGPGALGVSMYDTPMPEEDIVVLKRFRNVFALSYQRYTDIALAEAQARESQIQLGLERVRARTMAMQRSDELTEASAELYRQLTILGEPAQQLTIGIIKEDEGVVEVSATLHGNKLQQTFRHPLNEPYLMQKMYDAWKAGKKTFILELRGEELIAYNKFRNNLVGENLFPVDLTPDSHRIITAANFSKGTLALGTDEPRPAESLQLLERFAAVFELTFTRFQDLLRSEEQTREARIELALERVRARTMAMQRSEEMVEASHVLFNELHALGIETIRTGVATVDAELETVTVWSSQLVEKNDNKILGVVPRKAHAFFDGYYEAWKKKDPFFTYSMSGDEVRSYYITMSSILSYPLQSEFNSKETFQVFFFPEGSLNVITHVPLPEESCQLLIRFARVFGLIYRRFLDLKQAEAQAQEARIEASLERVRAVAMSMHMSDDLLNVCEILFHELGSLGFNNIRNAIIDIYDDEKKWKLNYDYSDIMGKAIAHVPYDIHPFIQKQIKEIRSAEDAFSETVFTGEELEGWKEFRRKSGQQDDPRVTSSSTLHYYFYSISKGAIGISTFGNIDAGELELLKRFRNVFSLSYQRYIDIVQAEAQAREAQIELALERVRARTMAMQRSDELSETAHILFQQFKELGESPLQITIGIVHEEKGFIEFRVTDWAGGGLQVNRGFNADINEPTLIHKMYTAWKEQKKSLVVDLSGKELEAWIHYRNSISGVSVSSMDTKGRRVVSCAFFSKGHLSFSTPEPRPTETVKILERFAAVFDQTYTRFLDLQKAEAQARESQIEAALERVRSRTMGMQKSEELKEVIQVVFDQFGQLNMRVEHTGFVMDYKERDDYDIWVADPLGVPSQVIIPYFDCVYYNRFNEAKEKGEDFFATHLTFEEKNEFYQTLFEYVPGLPEESKRFYFSCPGLAASTVLLENIGLYIENFSGIPYTDEENATLMRFGKVFQQTYTRFLDLQKAEAQTREAQIEAALEKVRSRSLAVHQSEEFKEVINIVFEKLEDLGLQVDTASINIFIEGSKDTDVYACGHNENGLDIRKARLRWFDHPIANDLYNVHKNGLDFFVGSYGMKEKNSYYTYQFEHGGLKELPDEIKERILQTEHYSLSMAPAKHSIIILNNIDGKRLSETEIDIVKRFARVFDQAYTRFLDLQKSEAQAREAKIEAALERVRAKAMAMHNSADIAETISAFYRELGILSETPRRCGIALIEKETRMAEVSTMNTTEQGESIEVVGKLKMTGHPVLDAIFDNWLLQKEYHAELRGNQIKEYYSVLKPQIAYPDYPHDEVQYGYYFMFKEGDVYAWTLKELGEDELNIYRRFTSVLSLTYRRYKDLKEAESQAKEAKIEAGLERVRSRTLAMQSSDELAETAAVLFRQLISLGIQPNRLYISIIEDQTEEAEFWITDEDGSKVSTAFHTNMMANDTFIRMFEAWKEEKKTLILDMQGKELENYFQNLSNLNVPFKGGLTQTRRVQHIAYFSKGFIGMASPDEQPAETMQLLERFATVFNLTFTRFNDLKIAEHHAEQAREDLIKLQIEKKRAEEALTELRATQAQLIQSEKMASLGELTAGIAHEIQNPLNFVNNFSEVNAELIDELNDELATGNVQLAKEIAGNIKDNEEKIVFHGKRADAIVKGMLQHSRSSSGQKEPTDINALADEYLRLAYHGLRAKDKTFNATMKTDFDPNIGLVNVVPQDIGRVILNLITNAFYAVSAPNPSAPKSPKGDFLTPKGVSEPTVIVSTKQMKSPSGDLGARAEIRVKDNGPGIPKNILDKIFQPFFTTKPTGQGTGLGLSLSYDIIKAHGGELKVETKEGKGSEFIIILPTNA